MFSIALRLPPDDLARHMSDMRVWLDGHRVETSGFSYEEGSDSAVARLVFSLKPEAEAFAGQFAGRLIPDRWRDSGRDEASTIEADPAATVNAGQSLAA